MLKMLLRAGAILSTSDAEGRTVLQHLLASADAAPDKATRAAYTQCVRECVSQGARPVQPLHFFFRVSLCAARTPGSLFKGTQEQPVSHGREGSGPEIRAKRFSQAAESRHGGRGGRGTAGRAG